MLLRALDVAASSLTSGLTWARGYRVRAVARQPPELLELYEFESCPFCRKVRETLCELDLDARILPCPPGGERFRREVLRRGGKHLFPYLVDPNAGTELYESEDIIRYLSATYADGELPLAFKLGPLSTLRAGLGSVPRLGRVRATPSKAPARDLELWSYEASPFSRIAREALCNLELPYVLHNVGKGSQKRKAFTERSGKMMVPFLFDPNTDTSMFESADIVRYLHATYGA